MMFGPSVILGLAFDERGVSCAEVQVQGSRRANRKLGRFTFPEGKSLAANAGQIGAELKTFLNEHGFTAHRAVLGVPSKWLIATERELPPADAKEAIAAMRMQAEAMTLSGGADMVVDVAGDVTRGAVTATAPAKVLLIGILKQQLDRLQTLATAAGLSVEAVTSTSLATYGLLTIDSPDQPLLLLSEGGAEVVAGQNGAVRLLRHVSIASPAASPGMTYLGSELRRTITLTGLAPVTQERPLLLWNGIGLAEEQVRNLADRTGVAMRETSGLEEIGAQVKQNALNGASGQMPASAFVPAAALAIVGAAGRPTLAVDFAKSRLAAPATKRFGRKTVWGVVLGVLAIAGIAYLYQTVSERETEAAGLADQAKKLEPQAKINTTGIDHLKFGTTFLAVGNRPAMLDPWAEVCRAFDDRLFDGPIWVTNFTVTKNDVGLDIVTLEGKTSDQNLGLELANRLKKNPKLHAVQGPNFGSKAAKVRDEQFFTFTIQFDYIGKD